MVRTLLSALLVCIPVHAADRASFEVASVKLAGPLSPGERRGCSGGPGTASPGAWSCPHIPLTDLIWLAHGWGLYQFKAPSWMGTTWLAISAKVPPGTTTEQFRQMQQHLLAERFKLVFHWQSKAMTVYDLVQIGAATKMRESSPNDASLPAVEFSVVPRFIIGKDQFPAFPEGASGLMGGNNRVRWRSSNVTMADMVRVLRQEMDAEVVDRTGLTGKYDVDLSWQKPSPETFPSTPPFEGPSLEQALRDRTGLRLEPRKGIGAVVVIDRIERAPVEN